MRLVIYNKNDENVYKCALFYFDNLVAYGFKQVALCLGCNFETLKSLDLGTYKVSCSNIEKLIKGGKKE